MTASKTRAGLCSVVRPWIFSKAGVWNRAQYDAKFHSVRCEQCHQVDDCIPFRKPHTGAHLVWPILRTRTVGNDKLARLGFCKQPRHPRPGIKTVQNVSRRIPRRFLPTIDRSEEHTSELQS